MTVGKLAQWGLANPLFAAIIYSYTQIPMNVPNWQKHSKKDQKGRGVSKGQMRARKQALRALKAKLLVTV